MTAETQDNVATEEKSLAITKVPVKGTSRIQSITR
jgi:hypothetical protein